VAKKNTDPSTSGATADREQVDGVSRLLVLVKMRRILDAFTPARPELSASEISVAAGLPASTTTRFIRNLEYDGLLERVGDRYRIGLAVVRWAGTALRGRDLVDIAGPVLTWLRDETGESVQLCVREGRFAVIINAASSFHSVARQMRIGEVNYLHAGATGKIFLAFDPGAMTALGTGPLEAFTSRTITDHEKLLASVAEVRAQGYAVTAEERNDGAVGISAPVFDAARRLAGSIGISGPTSRMTPAMVEAQVPLVVEAGRRLSESLGTGSIASIIQ